MGKKIEKDSDHFITYKIDFESQVSSLLTPPHYTNSQNSIISFRYIDF